MAEKVKITYETLFEILRQEKNNESLQNLDRSFYIDVVDYLKEKSESVKKGKENHFSEEEFLAIEKQLVNIKKILKELYSRREKKIIAMALNKARAISVILDTSAMLDEERKLYIVLVQLLQNNRKDVIEQVLNLEMPSITYSSIENNIKNDLNNDVNNEPKQNNELAADESREDISKDAEVDTDKVESETPAENPEKPKELKKDPSNSENEVLVRFLDSIPKFMGTDLKKYGPFEKEDQESLPESIADVLINKGRAQAI
ncbi:hypothetical protein ACFL0W_03195 [Nanoarchaeota archaeon]